MVLTQHEAAPLSPLMHMSEPVCPHIHNSLMYIVLGIGDYMLKYTTLLKFEYMQQKYDKFMFDAKFINM